MAISVHEFNHATGEVSLVSDAKSYAEQLSELRGIGIQDVAIRHAESQGRVVTGTISLGPQSIQYFDKKTGARISGNLNSGKYQDAASKVQPRRIVKLALTGSAASSFQRTK